MCGIVIRIREKDNAAEPQNSLIAMLEDLLSNEAADRKKHKLEEKYNMKITTELERRLDRMCNFVIATVFHPKTTGLASP